ncbi:hypothetical protein [Flavobacterium sp. NRK F7]|uniref:hypothetical protein n=1 Tax=Flavobacterium sp. NRK F7 TaxID=2954930 RepID=UPI0020917ED6|nr:hypothetical protein [Flavobacterium sp. NRK F7]MCO6163933.1 hypothetical protein [Flavobacterium sp. NRK F7]
MNKRSSSYEEFFFFKRKFLIGYFLVFFIFFLYKYIEIKDFDLIQGKVIAIEKVTVKECSRSGGCKYVDKYLPVIAFYCGDKKMEFSEGGEIVFNSLDAGDKVDLFVDTNNCYKVKINKLFYYWIQIPDLILIGLLLLIMTGTIKVFLNDV